MEAKKVKLQIKLLKAKIANLKKKKKTRKGRSKAKAEEGRPQNRFERAQETIEAQNRQIREAELKKSLTTLQSLLPSRDELFTRGLQAQVTSQIQQQAEQQKRQAEEEKKQKEINEKLLATKRRRARIPRQGSMPSLPSESTFDIEFFTSGGSVLSGYAFDDEGLEERRQKFIEEQQRESEKRLQKLASKSRTGPEQVRRSQPEPFVPFTNGKPLEDPLRETTKKKIIPLEKQKIIPLETLNLIISKGDDRVKQLYKTIIAEDTRREEDIPTLERLQIFRKARDDINTEQFNLF